MPARLSVRTGDHVALRGREAAQFDVVGLVRESIPGARIVAEVLRVALHKAARQSASNLCGNGVTRLVPDGGCTMLLQSGR